MYDENLHNIRIYFTNSHVHVLLYAYNCVIITYNLPGVKDSGHIECPSSFFRCTADCLDPVYG